MQLLYLSITLSIAMPSPIENPAIARMMIMRISMTFLSSSFGIWMLSAWESQWGNVVLES